MPPEMTQSLHSHVNMQNMQTLKTMPNLQFNMPPEMTQSLHSQVKEENSQNMQHMPRMHNMQYDVSGLHNSIPPTVAISIYIFPPFLQMHFEIEKLL